MPTVNLFGLPLMRQAAYEGRLQAFGAGFLTLTRTDWTDDEFNSPNGVYYVEILSGDHLRTTSDIVDTLGSEGTIRTADDLSTYLSGGELIRIGRHHTLFSVFGMTNLLGLREGNRRREADEIIIFNSASQRPTVFFFSSVAKAWVNARSPRVATSDFIIYPYQGIFLRSKGLRCTSGAIAAISRSMNSLESGHTPSG